MDEKIREAIKLLDKNYSSIHDFDEYVADDIAKAVNILEGLISRK